MKRPACWPSASIHTAASLQRTGRQLAWHGAGVTRVIAAMRKGATLQSHYERGRKFWRLSTGIFVTAEVANTVTQSPHVVGVGDCLFDSAGNSQTYRYVDHQEDKA
jgi:hypothetical protein